MSPEDAVFEVREMRRVVLREMPHVGCNPILPSHDGYGRCNCYKVGLLAALLRAEVSLLGYVPTVEPF